MSIDLTNFKEKIIPSTMVFCYYKKCDEKNGVKTPYSWVEKHYFLVGDEEVFSRDPNCMGKTTIAASLTDEQVLGKKFILKNNGPQGVSISLDDDSLGYSKVCEFIYNSEYSLMHVHPYLFEIEDRDRYFKIGDLMEQCNKINEAQYQREKDSFIELQKNIGYWGNVSSILSELE